MKYLLYISFCLFVIIHTSWSQSNAPDSPPSQIFVFDLEAYLENRPNNKVWQYDVINMVSALQGLVNRNDPQLYILYVRERLSGRNLNIDEYWLSTLRSPGGFLERTTINYVSSLEELIDLFRDYFSATVLWDPEVPATSNVALTISGADGLLPLRHDESPDSLFNQIMDNASLPPRVRLTDMFTGVGNIPDSSNVTTRVRKNDAYRWSKEQYLDTGLCSANNIGFYLDPHDWDTRAEGYQYPDLQNCMLVNHDYEISKRAFFTDLDPWWDEVPTDIEYDPFMQGIDEKTLKIILNSAYEKNIQNDRIIRVGGFIPWWVKYSNYNNIGGKHTPSETVERFIGFMSAYNGIIDGGGWPFAAIANSSFYQHIPIQERYYQNPIPPEQPLENKNYLLFSIGDFSSSALFYQTIPTLWEDFDRGTLPIAWAVSPIMSERVPHIFDYLYQTRTNNDYFVSATTGAGLNFPNRFRPPREYSGKGNDLFFWEKIARTFYQKFDLLITTSADLDRVDLPATVFDESLQEHFMSFSPQGISTLKPFNQPLVEQVVPFIRETNNIQNRTLSIKSVSEMIHNNAKTGQSHFHHYRFNLANPTQLNLLYQIIRSEKPEHNYELLDPYTFFYLYRQKLAEGDPSVNSLIPNYLSDTIPRQIETDSANQTTVTLRNDGWDIWNEDGVDPNKRYQLSYNWKFEGSTETEEGAHAAYIKQTVLPGERVTLPVLIEPPKTLIQQYGTGLYVLTLRFIQENVKDSYIQESLRVVIQ